MAEARAIATVNMGLSARRSGAVELFQTDEGITLSITIPKPKTAARLLKRKWHVIQNTIVNSFFPLGIVYVAAVVTGFVGVVLGSPTSSWWRSGTMATLIWNLSLWVPFFSTFPLNVRLIILASLSGLLACLLAMVAQRYVLRALLSWRGWMYVPRGSKPWYLVLWMLCVKSLTFTHKYALTYAFQGSLPRLPVPSLADTTRKYLDSIRALRDPESFAREKAKVDAFLENEGPMLQRYLWLKSIYAANYVTDWWEKYVYLRGRSPLMINSNYYINDSSMYCPTTSPAARAGDIIHGMLIYMRMIDHETLPVQMAQGAIPLCMDQTRRLFATTRIPGLEHDTLVHLDSGVSRHIVVLYRGVFSMLPMWYKGHMLDGYQIENQFNLLMEDVDAAIAANGEPGTEARISALTAANRTRWAEIREEHFSAGINARSLSLIERALFFVVLDPESPQSDAQMGRLNLMGHAHDRWFDKSITLILYANGTMGFNIEHSFADALCSGHMVEWAMTRHFGLDIYDDNGSIKPSSEFTKLIPYQGVRLAWDLNIEAQAAVEDAVLAAKELIADLDLQLYRHPWGKAQIKKCKFSPDAFVQMAMQLAYYRDHGSLCLTYEASTTRLFRNGRTETVRTCSPLVADFVAAMEDPNADSAQKIAALRAATDAHVLKFKDAMSGRGIDRHLFALYVVSVGRNIESEFLSDAISQPWSLSTSQQPQNQTDNWDPSHNPVHATRVSAGGGFGPVTDDGYGISYMMAGENHFYFHVSSKHSSSHTDSSRMVQNVATALNDILAVFDS